MGTRLCQQEITALSPESRNTLNKVQMDRAGVSTGPLMVTRQRSAGAGQI